MSPGVLFNDVPRRRFSMRLPPPEDALMRVIRCGCAPALANGWDLSRLSWRLRQRLGEAFLGVAERAARAVVSNYDGLFRPMVLEIALLMGIVVVSDWLKPDFSSVVDFGPFPPQTLSATFSECCFACPQRMAAGRILRIAKDIFFQRCAEGMVDGALLC